MKWTLEDLNRHVLIGKDRRLAVVTRTYYYGDGSFAMEELWRAFIFRTSEADVFPTLEQAKDWAQAVSILNH